MHKLDRRARNCLDYYRYKEILDQANVTVKYVETDIDFDTPEGKILEANMVAFAEYTSLNIAREALKGLKTNAYQCRHTGGKPPLGYDVGPDGKYIINDCEAELVKKIFEMRATGVGYGAIIDELRSSGYRTKTGGLFGKNSLHDILRNEKYIGTYTWGRVTGGKYRKRNNHKDSDTVLKIDGGIPQIVSTEVWEKVQKIREKDKHAPGSYKARELYLLSGGLVFCGCGSAMVGSTLTSKGRRYTYYKCNNKHQKHCCSAKRIKRDEIENIVLSVSYNLFQEDRAELIRKIRVRLSDSINKYENVSKLLRKERDQLNKHIQNLVNSISTNGDVDGVLTGSIRTKKQRIAEIDCQLVEEKSVASPITDEEINNYIEFLFLVNEKSPEDIRAIFQKIVRRVEISGDEIKLDFGLSFAWWRRGESNPCPKASLHRLLRAQSMV